MKKLKLLWLQSLTCNGNVHSFFNLPELFLLLKKFEIIYFPLVESKFNLIDILEKKAKCDILIIEGAIKKDLTKNNIKLIDIINYYANMAQYIITVGTCATFGGVFKEYEPKKISGFVFDKEEIKENYPHFYKKLISLPGCPIHPRWLAFVLEMIAQKKKIPLDELRRPQEIYNYTVHTGCVRNEYFEWKVDVKGFGFKEGCSFYELGCQGPYTKGSCNKILWNDISSKTKVGTPCFGCTEAAFPKKKLFFTETNMGIPKNMPLGVSKRAYLTLTGIAKSFTIKRLENPLIEYKDDN